MPDHTAMLDQVRDAGIGTEGGMPEVAVRDGSRPDNLAAAIDLARRAVGPEAWVTLRPAERSAAIYHELCRLDSGCRRTGTAADRDLPPCPASDGFIARRGCRLAGRGAALRVQV